MQIFVILVSFFVETFVKRQRYSLPGWTLRPNTTSLTAMLEAMQVSRHGGAIAKKKLRGQKPRRSVVERTHSWFNRFRGILTRWCKKATTYQDMLCFVCGLTAYRVGFDEVFGISVCEFPEMIIAKT